MEKNQIDQLKAIRHKITRFMMMYSFAVEELETKINILKDEFHLLHDYNPIEHTKSRVKSPESIVRKLSRKGVAASLDTIRSEVRDIAGLRITCSFVKDIYWICDMLKNQTDLHVIEIKDYIKSPKPNGYRSLHLIVQVPVFMSDRREMVYVEVQIRTIAMDFWASLEHKIFYKHEGSVPERLLEELKEAADSAAALDVKMEKLHRDIEMIKSLDSDDAEQQMLLLDSSGKGFRIPPALLALVGDSKGGG